jgi:putative spermidine/putrescine transport system substrate-binding protein
LQDVWIAITRGFRGPHWIFSITPTQVATQKRLGVPMEYAQLKEGAVLLTVARCVIARNDQPELARKLAAFFADRRSPGTGIGRRRPDSVKPTTPPTDKPRARVEVMQGYLQTAI